MKRSRGDAVVRLTRVRSPNACVFVAAERRVPRGLGAACHVFEKPLDYALVAQAVAACRAVGGPGLRGGCYMKGTGP